MTTPKLNAREHSFAVKANRWSYRISDHWMLIFSLTYGLFVGLPFLAPLLVQIGWRGGGEGIYFIYSLLCHQLPQRSLFFFGPKTMYSLSEVQAAWSNTTNPLVLRQFIGDPAMGWKVAWSDRMISMYTSIFLFAWLWYPLRKHVRPLPWWGFIIFLVPLGLDGITHTISDFAGIGQGFRDSNVWLAALTNNTMPAAFYSSDALGSFNSWMRWSSGILFGNGIIWFAFPYLNEAFSSIAVSIKSKFQRADLEL